MRVIRSSAPHCFCTSSPSEDFSSSVFLVKACCFTPPDIPRHICCPILGFLNWAFKETLLCFIPGDSRASASVSLSLVLFLMLRQRPWNFHLTQGCWIILCIIYCFAQLFKYLPWYLQWLALKHLQSKKNLSQTCSLCKRCLKFLCIFREVVFCCRPWLYQIWYTWGQWPIYCCIEQFWGDLEAKYSLLFSLGERIHRAAYFTLSCLEGQNPDLLHAMHWVLT